MLRLIGVYAALLGSVGMVLLGTGLLGSLLALRMDHEQFGTGLIGLVMACYSVGFVIASLLFGRVIARVGHIRAFSVLAALTAASTLTYPLLVQPLVWAAMRLIFGFCVAGLYMVAESWLNHSTPHDYRGRVLAGYSVVTYAALGGGQLLLSGWEVTGFELFSVAAGLFALSMLPMALTRAPAPELPDTRPIGLRRLYALSPLGLTGSAVAGVLGGAFLAMGPVFGARVGLDTAGISALMAAAMLGGLLLQWPVGRLSDRFGRRPAIIGVATGVMLVSLLLALLATLRPELLRWPALLWGGLAFAVYPLALALTNDMIDQDQRLGAGSALLLVHGLGMIAGPLLAARSMAWFGPQALFVVLAGFALCLALFGLRRHRVAPPLDPALREHFVSVPTTTPVGVALDPRMEDPQHSFDFDAGEVEADMVNKPLS